MSNTVVWSSTNVVRQVAKRPVGVELPSRDLALRYIALTLEKLDDTDLYQFDYVVDAGVSNIVAFSEPLSTSLAPSGAWSFVPSTLNYDVETDSGYMGGVPIAGRIVYWKHVCDLFVDYCRRRQDCMALLDSPRPLTLKGDAKLVRKTDAEASFYREVARKLQHVPMPNSQFAAVFFNWWSPQTMENNTERWLPPSTLAAEVYCREPFWRAPAGLNYGWVPNVSDLSVNPSRKQQSLVYDSRMNYFVTERGATRLEGQRTTQAKPSAFDRVSARRLFNFMNRSVGRIMKYFVYQPNNDFTQRRVVDTVDILMSRVRSLEAVYDYTIVCDSALNTPDVVDRNELRVVVMVKPMKHAEFIKASFVATRSDADLAEVYSNLQMSDAMNW